MLVGLYKAAKTSVFILLVLIQEYTLFIIAISPGVKGANTNTSVLLLAII